MGKLKKAVNTLIGLLLIAFYIVPFYITITVAFKKKSDLSSRWVFPHYIYLNNFATAINEGHLDRAVLNSVIITIFAIIIVVCASSIAAYPLARIKSRFSTIITSIVLGVMMVPSLSILVPLYGFMVNIKAVNSYWGIILVLATYELPLSIFFYKNFISSVPNALDEAARIDGCGMMGTFFKIILPQLKPVTASVIILTGVKIWNDYRFSLYFLQSSTKQTIVLAISNFFNDYSSNLNAAAAAALIGAIPMVIVYLSMQKYFVSGLADGAVKS